MFVVVAIKNAKRIRFPNASAVARLRTGVLIVNLVAVRTKATKRCAPTNSAEPLTGQQNLALLTPQLLWLVWILASKSYGLLPMNLALWIVYGRNYLKWKP